MKAAGQHVARFGNLFDRGPIIALLPEEARGSSQHKITIRWDNRPDLTFLLHGILLGNGKRYYSLSKGMAIKLTKK